MEDRFKFRVYDAVEKRYHEPDHSLGFVVMSDGVLSLIVACMLLRMRSDSAARGGRSSR